MSNQITITLSQTRRNAILGKVITLLMIGFVCGYFFGVDQEAEYEKGLGLTLEQYVAEFEAYKSELTEKPPSRWEVMLAFNTGIFVVIGIYELVARLVGGIVGTVLKYF